MSIGIPTNSDRRVGGLVEGGVVDMATMVCKGEEGEEKERNNKLKD